MGHELPLKQSGGADITNLTNATILTLALMTTGFFEVGQASHLLHVAEVPHAAHDEIGGGAVQARADLIQKQCGRRPDNAVTCAPHTHARSDRRMRTLVRWMT